MTRGGVAVAVLTALSVTARSSRSSTPPSSIGQRPRARFRSSERHPVRMTRVIALVLGIASLADVASVESQVDHVARGTVIQALEPNLLLIGGAEFVTKPNPHGEGLFVYDPRTTFFGVERYLIWFVLEGEAYSLNGPSKMVTPSLKWPREAKPEVWRRAGFSALDATAEGIAVAFGR